MKKLLFILTLSMVVLLGACQSNAPEYATQAELEQVQQDLAELQERFDNLVITTGLNGQVDYYENSVEYQDKTYLSFMSFELLETKEKDFIDASKFPDYIWDNNDEYVSIQRLGELLTTKYYGGTTYNDTYGDGVFTTGFQFRYQFTLNNETMTNDEFIARTILLIMELQNYDYYTIDTTQLYMYVEFNGQTVELFSRMALLINDKYVLDPAIFYGQMLDVRIEGITYNNTIVQQYYDDFVNSETFTGYVLNYE